MEKNKKETEERKINKVKERKINEFGDMIPARHKIHIFNLHLLSPRKLGIIEIWGESICPKGLGVLQECLWKATNVKMSAIAKQGCPRQPKVLHLGLLAL